MGRGPDLRPRKRPVRRPLGDRIWAKVDMSGGPDACWPWLGGRRRDGYGTTSVLHRKVYAHRLTYELVVGPIPKGLELDHLCRVHECVNLAHLEPVTHAENLRRGVRPPRVFKSHCKHGHAMDTANTRVTPEGYRCCRTCGRNNTARYMRNQREQIA